MSTPSPIIHWQEAGQDHSAHWRSESGAAPPKRVVIADDRLNADSAYRLACEGTALLWRGDFQNARQLLQALARRVDSTPVKKAKRAKTKTEESITITSPSHAFNLHRQAQSQRARTLAMLLIPFDADYSIPLRRAPDVKLACNEAYGKGTEPFVASLRELLGVVGAHEWRKNGVEIAALGQKIHPHYGVFSPIRGEYLGLIAEAPLPSQELAFDIGTGTGVIAALLAKRGVARIVATDQDPRALACARENLHRLDLQAQVNIQATDLFPEGRAPLIVCNPPWLPARANSPIEHAIYDREEAACAREDQPQRRRVVSERRQRRRHEHGQGLPRRAGGRRQRLIGRSATR
ncbi:MAG: class I SAM-dependent methyltransferase, partial [Pseudomonadota bacterium]